MSKRPISLSPGAEAWRTRSAAAPPPEAPEPPKKPVPLDAATIKRINGTIDCINDFCPISRSMIMRTIGKGSVNMSTIFDAESPRATEDDLAQLIALFGCTTGEEFFALGPGSPGLRELINTKGLAQHHRGRTRF